MKIEKKIEHYIQMFSYVESPKGLEIASTITQVEKSDPLLFDNNHNWTNKIGFRFYDIQVVESKDINTKIRGEKHNFSPLFYYGKREKVGKPAIRTDFGILIQEPEPYSLTIDEYKEEVIKKENLEKVYKFKI